MIFINVSRRQIHKGSITECSSQSDDVHSSAYLLKEGGFWRTKQHNSMTRDYVVLDYGEELPFNFVEMKAASSGGDAFPISFRLEGSKDGTSWKVLFNEKHCEVDESRKIGVDFPITYARYIKVFILKHRKIDNRFYSEIGPQSAGIAGVKSIQASSTSAHEHDVQKLLDVRKETFWESELKSTNEQEVIQLDLGNIFHINQLALISTGLGIHGFPEHFALEVSTDNNVWNTILEEKGFVSEPSRRYIWDIEVTPVRYLHLLVNGTRLEGNLHGVRLGGMEISAAYLNPYHTHNIGDLTPIASVFSAGIVKLAKDGEDDFGTVVQASDRRLRDATTIFKGIIQLANDSECREGLAVQASDSRLQPATDIKPGIVRVAYDREVNPETVVRSSDSRLKEATENNYGIVKLCPDGMYSDMAVVRGNDSRLKKATVFAHGICRLAEDGEADADCVVRGNDRRLKEASVMNRGIVELAEDGEDAPGVVVQGSDRRLKDATIGSKGIVELAEDGESTPGTVVQGNDRRLRDATTVARGIVELAEDGEDAPGVVVQGNDRRLKDATIGSRGIVELAEDGEDAPSVVVQGNDRRLKDATEIRKGILRFARDGESENYTAVQASDCRLKEASVLNKGIVELAEDGEDAPGVVVQGSDRRLKNATTVARGIVELAEDGEDRSGVVVQGNDRRLKDATEVRKGILCFARAGESAPLAAVQSSDKRLKEATTFSSGIVELSEDGESTPGTVVQGHDRRLKDGTTVSRGIVELAEDGEETPGVVVQGNDRRLKSATTDGAGIVRLAQNGEELKGLAVQADDRRLSDARVPLEHRHDYAPLKHDFSSHEGSIVVIQKMAEPFSGITPPPVNASTVYGRNESDLGGAVGVAGVTYNNASKNNQSYGILGHSSFVGVRGQSSGEGTSSRGAGVIGISRFGAGGVFSSEHTYSLVADGFGQISDYDGSAHLIGNGEALLVRGKADFNGAVTLANSVRDNQYPANIVEMFEVDEQEYISSGDLLVISEKGRSLLSRARGKYSRSVVGVVSGNPTLIINNAGTEQKVYPVALAGKALCKVDAREKPIRPGDLIVTSDTPGCGMRGEIDSFQKIGTVIGKALEGMEDGLGTIAIFIAHL